LGLRSGQILLIFLGKAVLLGLFGGVLGYAAGFAMGLAAGESGSGIGAAWRLFHPGLFFMVVLTAPLLAGLASWVPALVAARIDPAEILREE
jgi:ABC-type antimicrobial peptide transport system permease subunit